METKTKRALGKGLGSLIKAGQGDNGETLAGYLPEVPIDDISPNPKQPRMVIDPEELMGLADSIREYGIIEPLIVIKAGRTYQLVAGERRWRAAKLAMFTTVPVVVKELSEQQTVEVALVENIQRKDLNALEEAMALNELFVVHELTLSQIAKKVGKDESTISNKMRLLKMPDEVQKGLLTGKINETQALIILALKSRDAMLAVYNIVVKKKLGIPETENLVHKITNAHKEVMQIAPKSNSRIYDEYTQKIQADLASKLGKGFHLVRKVDGGKITIPFFSSEQLELIYKFVLDSSIQKPEVEKPKRKKSTRR